MCICENYLLFLSTLSIHMILQVSVMTKLVPSPDWFIGLDSLDLCSQGAFVESVVTEVGTVNIRAVNGTSQISRSHVDISSSSEYDEPSTWPKSTLPSHSVIVCGHKWLWIYWLSITQHSHLSLSQHSIWWSYHYFIYPHNAVKIFSDSDSHVFLASASYLSLKAYRPLDWQGWVGAGVGWVSWGGWTSPDVSSPHLVLHHLHTLAPGHTAVLQCCSAAVSRTPVTHSRNI